MVPELGRAAKKFAGLKASDAISKGKSRCEASDRLAGSAVTLMFCDSHKNTLNGNGSGLAGIPFKKWCAVRIPVF